MVLSFAILHALHLIGVWGSLSDLKGIRCENSEANEDNGSKHSAPHKGDFRRQAALDQRPPFLSSFKNSQDLAVTQQPFTYGIMGSMEKQSHFKKIQSFKVDYTEAEVTQYESQRTGMRVSVVDRKGPKVWLTHRRCWRLTDWQSIRSTDTSPLLRRFTMTRARVGKTYDISPTETDMGSTHS